MSFMQPQIVFGEYYEVDGSHGVEVIPADLVGHPPMVLGEWYSPGGESDPDGEIEEFVYSLDPYLDCGYDAVMEVRRVEGYGARLSAPGYMDCTPWSVFRTEKEAMGYLEAAYGESEGGTHD